MSEDADKESKTEDPSEKKIRDTLEKGNVPFSREFTAAFSVLAILLMTVFYIPVFIADMTAALTGLLANISDWPMTSPSDTMNLFNAIGVFFLWHLSPIILPLLVFGLAASLGQNLPRFAIERIKPKFSKISPAKGLKRLFGKQTVAEFFKSSVKFGSAGIVAGIICYLHLESVLQHSVIEAVKIPQTIHDLSVQVIAALVLFVAALGIADFFYVRHTWYDELKMTRQEVKDELKQSESDPMIRQKTRSVARDRARRRMISDVESATLVIANPTHFSVALRYRHEVDRVPFVLAKGQDRIALKIREVAESNDIPVIEDKKLARALYSSAEVQKELPAEFYVPVAFIIRQLLEKEKQVAGR